MSATLVRSPSSSQYVRPQPGENSPDGRRSQCDFSQAVSWDDLCQRVAAAVQQQCSARHVAVRIARSDAHSDVSLGDTDWAPLGRGLLMRLAQTGRPIVRQLEDEPGSGTAAVAFSLDCGQQTQALVVTIVPSRSLADAQACLDPMISCCHRLPEACRVLRLSQKGSKQLEVLEKSLRYRSSDEFCFAVANGLRVEIDADVVAVGLVRGQRVRLCCVSGLDAVSDRSPGSRWIQQSMEEALDAGRTICVQRPQDRKSGADCDGFPLTMEWQQQSGNVAVMSLPLLNAAGECVAVVSVQERPGRMVTAEHRQAVHELAAPLAASVQLLQAGHRSWWQHTRDSVRLQAQRICGPLRVRAALTLTVLAGLIAWMVLGTTMHTVRTPCAVVAAEIRQVAAPREAVLSQLYVQAGQRVQQGQLLAELDTEDLLLELDLARSDLRAAQAAVMSAAAGEVAAEIGQAVSRRAAAADHIRQLEQLSINSRILAPVSGQIVSDDLQSRVGETVPLGEPLFEIVASEDLAVELTLPESVLDCVAAGQSATVSWNAAPGRFQEFQLERLEPVTRTESGATQLVARARLTQSPAWLRPGMQGVAQVETGERAVWWSWLHTTVDAVRYEVWALTGTGFTEDSVGQWD